MPDDEEWEDTCCFCSEHIPTWHEGTKGRGNNPEPLQSWPKRCCDDCNATVVIPYRLGIMHQPGGDGTWTNRPSDRGTFTCAGCKVTFNKVEDWSDEQAAAEHERNFGEPVPEDAMLVCTQCYTKLMRTLTN